MKLRGRSLPSSDKINKAALTTNTILYNLNNTYWIIKCISKVYPQYRSTSIHLVVHSESLCGTFDIDLSAGICEGSELEWLKPLELFSKIPACSFCTDKKNQSVQPADSRCGNLSGNWPAPDCHKNDWYVRQTHFYDLPG